MKLIASRQESVSGCIFMSMHVCGGAHVRSGLWVAVEAARGLS